MRKSTRLTLLILLCLGLIVPVFGQTNLNNKPTSPALLPEDTLSVSYFLKMARIMEDSTQYDSALEYLSRASSLCARDSSFETEDYAHILYEMGRCYSQKNNDAEALGVHQRALQIQQRILPANHPDIALSSRQLSIVLRSMGKYPEALTYGQRALDIQLKALGPDSFDLASTYLVIGNVLRFQASYPAAIAQYEKALAVYSKTRPEGHVAFGDAFYNLSTIYRLSGNLAKAQEFCEKALQTYLTNKGPDHTSVAMAYMSRGNIYRVLAAYDNAMADYQAALAIYSKKSGLGSINVASTYIGIANVLNLGKGEYAAAEKYYQQALSIYLEKRGPDDPSTIGIYNNMGTLYEEIGELSKAQQCYERTLKSNIKRFGASHPAVAQAYTNLGTVFEAKEDYEKSLECYEKSLIIQQKMLMAPMDLAITYARMGNAYYQKGDYDLALQYYLKTLDIGLKNLPEGHPKVTGVYIGIGNVNFAMKAYDTAIKYYQISLDIQKKTEGDSSVNLASTYLNIGSAYFYKEDYEAALSHFQQALDLHQKRTDEKPLEIATIYSNLAGVFMVKQGFEKGIEYEKKAMDLYTQFLGPKSIEVSASFINLAEAYQRKGYFSKALEYIAQAEETLGYRYPFSPEKILSVQKLEKALTKKGMIYWNWYNQSSTKEHLYSARQAYSEAAKATHFLYRDLHSEKSQAVLLAQTTPLQEGLLRCIFKLHEMTNDPEFAQEAFIFCEKSKSLLLLHAIQRANALHFAGIPDSILEQEHQFRVDIALAEKKHQELNAQKLESDGVMIALSNQLFSLNRQYDSLITRINQQFPIYYNLKYNIKTTDFASVQSRLTPGQTLLEYVVGDSTLFVFVIGKSSFHIENIKIDFPLETWVTELRNAMTTERSTKATVYCARAHELYQKLIAPVKDRLSGDLIIIPDGILNYLPFEALLSEMPEKPARFRNHPYLLNEYHVSYCYSATLLREMQEKREQQTPTDYLLAIAPYFSGDTIQLDEVPNRGIAKKRRALRHSGSEVYGIRRIMGGDVLQGEAATKEHFIQIADKYRILHLATHGQANEQAGDYSLVAFAEPVDTSGENLLFVRDIYNMALNADLVTLSACETGIGKLQRGEGVISVARAFAYAGAGSIVTSLWDVDDEQSKDLMLLFYKELRKGASKNEALQTAKRTLSKRPDSHPFFWAAFIGIGDMRPLAQSGK